MKALACAALIGTAAAAVVVSNMAYGQHGLADPRPQGYFGVGHDEHHDMYLGLKNRRGGSCCNGLDCRPTTARWNGARWEALVDGVWTVMSDPETILDQAFLQSQKRDRWDTQAHVCSSRGGKTWAPSIYCFIPPDSGQ